MLLKLVGHVFDGRERAKHVDRLIRRLHIDLQFAVVRAHLNMLIPIFDLDKIGVWVFVQLFLDCKD